MCVDQREKLRVTVTTATHKRFRSRYVISAIPQTLLNRISFFPALPPKKIQLIQRIPMGSVIKTLTFYSDAFWKEMGLSGQMSGDSFPVSSCMDDAKPDGKHPCIVGFIAAKSARQLVASTYEERRDLVRKQYADVFRCDKFLDPTDYVEQNWMSDEFSGGCYVSVFAPGVLSTLGEELRKPFSHVHFAGSESARICVGYMNGAIESGMRVASEILNLMNRSAL